MPIRKRKLTALVNLAIAMAVNPLMFGQSEKQLTDFLKRNPHSDKNEDGTLTREDARAVFFEKVLREIFIGRNVQLMVLG